jgi:branched-chain amino acid transport system substrate-binding protein
VRDPRIAPLSSQLKPALTPLALGLALLVGGCGGGGTDETSATVPGRTLTVYSSLPKSGPSAPMGRAVLAGQRQALADARGRAGGYRIRLVELDSSRPDGDAWEPSQVAKGVGRAAEDPTTIAYLGELDLGASAISLPVTSSKGILQVSPADELTSLTRIPPGRPRATPERLYPEGVPNFVRLVPHDLLQARALVDWAKDRGARRIWIAGDPGIYGDELAAQTSFVARRSGMTVLGQDLAPEPEDAADKARSIVAERPDAVLYTGDVEDGTVPLLNALTALAPRTPVFASSAVTESASAVGGVRGELYGVKPGFPAGRYPAAGRRVLRSLAREDRDSADVEALYGYESVALALDAIEAAGRRRLTRAAVRRAALVPRLRRSALGVYRIKPGGEVSSRGFAGYVVRDGELHSPAQRPPAG